jgi:hypothetical protein
MTAEIIAQVLDAGGHIAVDGTDLVLTAPRPLPDDLLAQIREHKRSILDALAGPDPLSPAAERRRRKVLAMARDGKQYAIVVDDPSTDPVAMTLATPDDGTWRGHHPQGSVRPARHPGEDEGMAGVTNPKYTVDEAAAEIDEDDPEMLAAHLEGMRRLGGWEGDDFGRERHVRLFDEDLEDPDGAPEGRVTQRACETADV